MILCFSYKDFCSKKDGNADETSLYKVLILHGIENFVRRTQNHQLYILRILILRLTGPVRVKNSRTGGKQR